MKKMINYIYNRSILILILIAASLTGCEDFLEENPGQALLTPSYSTEGEVDAAVTGIYASMTGTWGSGIQSSNGSVVYAFSGDDITTHPSSNKGPFREFDQLNMTSNNERMPLFYGGAYNVIFNANVLLAGIENAQVPQSAKDLAIGQARFLRGIAYFYLVRVFGDLPVLTSPEIDVIDLQKSSVKDVYDQVIVPDLIEAEKLLPDQMSTGKPNKGTAKAYLSKVYLTMAGWPLKESDKYAMAAQKAKEVIDNKGTYGFDLIPDFADLWKIGNKFNAESIFEVSHNDDVKTSICGKIGAPGDIGGWDEMFAEISFYNNFPECYRKEVTFLEEVISLADGVTIIPWQNFGMKHPYYRKWLDGNGWIDGVLKVQRSSNARNIYMMRYAEVLLIYAEAQVRSGSANTEAYSAINEVRLRAGLAELSGLSDADFITAVVNERAWELACEFKRWFDMTRLEIVADVFATRDAAENPVIGDPNNSLNWYSPFPQSEIELNPNLK